MTENQKLLAAPQGAGGFMGGGGGGSPPTQSMQSVAYATMLDILCEGEIKGLVNGLQSIYLNGVPVQQVNGQYNFVGTSIGWVNGTQAQPYIPGFTAVQATQTLGTQVLNSVPVTSQISNVAATAVIITLAVGQLSNTDSSSGNVSGTSVLLQVDYQPTGGSWITALQANFDGYVGVRYERSYRFPLTGTGPWTVRVTRITPDSTISTLVSTTYVDAVTTVVDTKLSYPNTALVGFKIDARQFSNVPQRSYLIDGMLIRVPNNYNPITRAYSGVWNGGFQIAFSNNPAWCLYDLLLSDRYGLGLYINTAQIDVTSLYQIGQYCDELVPDGFGGQEPRFTLNTAITTAKDAYSLIQDLTSVFRGMTYWGAGTILTTQDAPYQAPKPLFSPANVVNGQFTYAGSMRKDRHTVAYVTFNDPNQQYIQATEYVEDPVGLTRYGVRAASIMAVGCTSRGQAYRLGQWQLLSERLNTDQVQFTAGMDAAQLTPGTVIQIADPVRAGVRMSGRIVSGTVNGIVLDAPVTLTGGQAYTIYFMDAAGAEQTVGIVNTANTTDTLTFTTPTTTAPNSGFMWMMSGSNINPQLFRVINVAESARNTFDVLAVTYNESKFGAIDFNTALQIPPVSLSLSLVAIMPSSWSLTPASYLIAPGVIGQKLVMSWSGNSAQYTFQWRDNGGPWQTVALKTPSYTLGGVTAGDTYDFQVYAISVDGTISQPLVQTYTVPKLGLPPGAPTNLTASGAIRSVVLNWSAPSNLDLDHFQVYMASTNDVTKASIVANMVGSTSWTVGNLLSGSTYYFWVNAVNTSGVVGPYNSSVGTSATVPYVQPGDFSLNSILNAISTAGDITGALIRNASITQANIAAQAVGTLQIQDAAIATGKIASGAVTATQIANAAITTANIQNGAITTALIGTAAVGTAQIQNAAVTSALIANAAVGTAQIQDAGITNAKIGTAQVSTLTIGANAVTTGVFAQQAGQVTLTVGYTASGGPCTIIYGAIASGAALSLVIDGSTYDTANNSSGNCVGFYVITLGAGYHTVQVVGAANNPKLSIFEAKR